MEKYKVNDEVVCNGNVGSLWFNHVKGKIIRRNRFTGNYLIKFTTYQLELHEEQIELINKMFDVVLIPNGEVIRLREDKYNEYIDKKIIYWDEENECYVLPYQTFKNSL